MSVNRGATFDRDARYEELFGLRFALTEIRHRLEQFGLAEAVEHLEITDIAIAQTLMDIRIGAPGALTAGPQRGRRNLRRTRSGE